MSFSTMKEPCKEGYRLNSQLKIVNHTKFSARGAAYLCKVTIAARSPYGRPPARRVGWAFPVRRRGVCRRGVYRAAVGSAQLARRGGKSTSAGRSIPPWWGLTVVFGVCRGSRAGWKKHQRRPPIPPDGA